MKKKILYLALCAAAAALVGCNKEASASLEGNALVTFQVKSATEPGTKATDITDGNEAAVSSLQVFVFDSEGSREAYGAASGSKSIALTCSKGDKTAWAVVNCADLSSIQTIADLKAVYVQLTDNSADHFQMGGFVNQTISAATATVTIPVNRYASRIVIKKITNRLKSEALHDKEFKVKGIYVINAQGKNTLALDGYQGAAGVWYDQMKYEASNTAPTLHDELDKVIAYEASLTEEHRFYSFPNDVKPEDDVNGGTWSPRLTRLVIEATLDGKTQYYPITMNLGFEANKSYEIEELVITKSGSSDPDFPVTSEDITFTVNVKDWTAVLMGDNGTVTI